MTTDHDREQLLRTLAELGVPMKRAVLFEGPYGTGKTLGAYLTAKEAVANGWTFIYCRPSRDDLFDTIATARLYQPAVVFFEDIDVVGNGDGDHVSRLLDVLDGIEAKGTELVCVLTTNHVERIHKGMVRPGRLDAIIHIGALDPRGVRRMVEATVPEHLLEPNLHWPAISEAMEGFLPAFVREAIDRTVRYNLARNEGKATPLATVDFVTAANGLRPQLELMENAADTKDVNHLAVGLEQAVERVVGGLAVRTEPDGSDDWPLVPKEDRHN